MAERLARSKRAESIRDTVVGSTVKRVQANNPATPEDALKKAKIALAMSRAQLNKSLKAFGHPPIAEQAARLVELQREYEAAEQALEALLTASSPTDTQETFCS